MRLKKYLQELFLMGVEGSKAFPRINLKWVEFFVNPSKREMKDAAGGGRAGVTSIRFIADLKKKKVFVWHPHFLHHSAWKEIGDGRVYSNDETILAGIAEQRGSNWVMVSATGIGGKPIEKWKWVEKYIKISEFMKTFRGPDLKRKLSILKRSLIESSVIEKYIKKNLKSIGKDKALMWSSVKTAFPKIKEKDFNKIWIKIVKPRKYIDKTNPWETRR